MVMREQPLHEECIAAVRKAAGLCESLGHQVEEGEIEVPLTPEILTPTLGSKLRQKLIKTG